MDFKDMLHADVRNVFLNVTEFADHFEYNCKTIACSEDKDQFIKYAKQKFNGVFQRGTVIYVARDEFERDPVPGERVRFDGLWQYIDDVSHDKGMLCITMTENTA